MGTLALSSCHDIECLLSMILQAGALRALPEVDRETAEDLRRRQQSQESASTLGVDDTPPVQQRELESTPVDDAPEKQHVLIRPVRRERERFGSAAADRASSSPPSIWDSYDAEEEAAVLALSTATSFDYKASIGGRSAERKSSTAPSRQADSAQPKMQPQMDTGSSVQELRDVDTAAEALTRRTEEDLSPVAPLFL